MFEKINIKIISIESTSSVCSVSLSFDDSIVSEYSIYEKNYHDKLLAKLIKTSLEDFGLSINEIDAVAISSGPGSFTGLRIGFAIAKGICFDGKIKLLAIPTLKAIANEQIEIAKLCSKNIVMPIIYSNQNFFYAQVFDLHNQPITDVQILTYEDIKRDYKNNYLISGPAAKTIIPETPDICTKLTSSTISKLAINYYKNSFFSDPSEVTPDYFQKFKIK